MVSNAKEIATEAARLRMECIQYKAKRQEEMKKFIDRYNNVQGPIIAGYFNIPLPIVGGYVDTLLSKTDEPVSVTLSPTTEADYTRAKLMTAAFNYDHGQNEDSDWDAADRQERKIACFCGKGIGQVYAESDPKYRSVVNAIEFEDFIFDPLGPEDLEGHTYQGWDGLWKSKRQLQGDLYAQDAVDEIFEQYATGKFREEDEDAYNHKKDRYISLSLNPYDYSRSAVGQAQFVEMGLVWKDGERYYVLFESRTKIPIRCELWKDVFASNLWDKVTWSTHEDTKNFLNKTPLHDIIPVADAMQIAFNMTMDNVRKRNMNQKLFRSGDLVDPNQLRNFVPDGLIEISTNAVGRALSDIVVDLQTPDTTGITERLITFLDGFLGQKTGVTPSAQGAGQEKQATILMSNLKQVADRLGLYNKYYTRAQRRKVLRWMHGQYEHAPAKRVLKTIGAGGMVQWMTMFRRDMRPEFDIVVTSKNAEEANDVMAKQEKANALTAVQTNPNLASILNPKKTIEAILKNGNYEDEEVMEFLDKDVYANRDLWAAAQEACEEIMDGKEPRIKVNQEANLGFLLKINQFIKKLQSSGLDPLKLVKLNEYFNLHVPIAVRNEQQAQSVQSLLGMMGNPNMAPAAPGMEEEPPNRFSLEPAQSSPMTPPQEPPAPALIPKVPQPAMA